MVFFHGSVKKPECDVLSLPWDAERSKEEQVQVWRVSRTLDLSRYWMNE